MRLFSGRVTNVRRTSVFVLVTALSLPAASQSLRKLDDGSSFPIASLSYQISDNGRYATGTIGAGQGAVVRWDLTTPTAYWGNAVTNQTIGLAGGISGDGQVVAGAYGTPNPSGDFQAAYRSSGGLVLVPELPNTAFSYVQDMSGSGQILIGHVTLQSQSSLASNRVFRYNTATQTLEDLGFFGPAGTAAWIRSDRAGDTIVGSGTGLSSYWTQSTGWVAIPGLSSFGYEVSDNGRYIVGTSKFSGGGPRGMIYDLLTNSLTDLGTLGGAADMYAMTDQQVVVGTSVGSSGSRAVWWRPGIGMTDLNLDFASVVPAGWTLWEARDITPDGRFILGTARNEFGVNQAFVIDTVPEPASLVAVLVGLAALRRRKRN